MISTEMSDILRCCAKFGIYAVGTVEAECPVTNYGVFFAESYKDTSQSTGWKWGSESDVDIFEYEPALSHMVKLIDKGCYYPYPDGQPIKLQSVGQPIDTGMTQSFDAWWEGVMKDRNITRSER